MLRFTCPHCGHALSAPPECAGRASKCRACGQAFVVPVPVAKLVEEHITATPPVPEPTSPPATQDNPPPKGLSPSVLRRARRGAGVGAVVGVLLSQYWPVFGDFATLNIAKPWSPARESLIPIHFLVFAALGGMLAAIGWFDKE